MSEPPKKPKAPSGAGKAREDRLKAALRANLGRRKAQARVRDREQVQVDEAGQAEKE